MRDKFNDIKFNILKLQQLNTCGLKCSYGFGKRIFGKCRTELDTEF